MIRTPEDFEVAIARINQLWGAPESTPEGDELEVLMTLAEAYESRSGPIAPPEPVEAIRFVMDQRGLPADPLVPYLGSRARVLEVLSGKRALTLSMIRKLHQGLGIPLQSLVGDAASEPSSP